MEVFCKKGVLRNFAKFTGKHRYQSFFFDKVPKNKCKKATFCLGLQIVLRRNSGCGGIYVNVSKKESLKRNKF